MRWRAFTRPHERSGMRFLRSIRAYPLNKTGDNGRLFFLNFKRPRPKRASTVAYGPIFVDFVQEFSNV